MAAEKKKDLYNIYNAYNIYTQDPQESAVLMLS